MWPIQKPLLSSKHLSICHFQTAQKKIVYYWQWRLSLMIVLQIRLTVFNCLFHLQRSNRCAGLPGLKFSWPKKNLAFLKLVGSDVFEHLLSSWPLLKSIKVSIVKSKNFPVLKRNLAFICKNLETLCTCVERTMLNCPPPPPTTTIVEKPSTTFAKLFLLLGIFSGWNFAATWACCSGHESLLMLSH